VIEPRPSDANGTRGIIPLMARSEPVVGSYQLDSVLDFMRLLWSVEHGLERMSKRMGHQLGITGDRKSTRLNSSHR